MNFIMMYRKQYKKFEDKIGYSVGKLSCESRIGLDFWDGATGRLKLNEESKRGEKLQISAYATTQ